MRLESDISLHGKKAVATCTPMSPLAKLGKFPNTGMALWAGKEERWRPSTGHEMVSDYQTWIEAGFKEQV